MVIRLPMPSLPSPRQTQASESVTARLNLRIMVSLSSRILTTAFSFFTNKVGFLGCIVVPCLLLAGLVLRNCVNNIYSELERSKEENAELPQADESDPPASMTAQEYEEMLRRIREELTQELLQQAHTNKGEQDVGILEEEKTDTIQ